MSDWDSIEGLYMVVSGLSAHTEVTTDGSNYVTRLRSVFGVNQLPADITSVDPVTFDPATIKIGELPAFDDGGSGKTTNMSMVFSDPDLPDPTPFNMSLGSTIVAIVQLAVPNQGAAAFGTRAGTGNYGRSIATRDGSNWRITIGNKGTTTDIARTTEPCVLILTQNGNINSGKLYVGDYNGASWDALASFNAQDHSAEAGILADFNLLNSDLGNSGSMYGKGAMWVLYNQGVDDTEAQLLYDIAKSYVDTGLPITPVVPPSVSAVTPTPASGEVGGELTFNCTVTGDGPPTEEWEASIGGGAWQSAADAFGAGNVSTAPGQITISSLAEQTDTLITLRATNAGSPGGVVATPATFSVQASYPTYDRFGPVKTNDPENTTYQWQLQAPGDTDNWQDVPVDGYDITPDVVGDDQYLDVNSATAAQNGTLVRCKATSSSNPTGIFTNVNTLNVVEA